MGNTRKVQERALIQAWSETKFKSLKAVQNFCKHSEKHRWQKMSLPRFCKKRVETFITNEWCKWKWGTERKSLRCLLFTRHHQPLPGGSRRPGSAWRASRRCPAWGWGIVSQTAGLSPLPLLSPCTHSPIGEPLSLLALKNVAMKGLPQGSAGQTKKSMDLTSNGPWRSLYRTVI